jgi:hypothetical protein
MDGDRPATEGRAARERSVLSPAVLLGALFMAGAGFGGALLVDRYVLSPAAESSPADAGVAVAARPMPAALDVAVPSADAATGAPAADAAPDVADAHAAAPDVAATPDAPAVDASGIAVGEASLDEFSFRSRGVDDPLKIFSWAQVEVDLEGAVGDVSLELDLKNCPHDTDARLVSPAGTMVLLWSERGSTADWTEIQGTFPETREPLESLCALRGETARGKWRLRVGDSKESCRALLRTGRLVFAPPTRVCPPAE